MKNDVAWEMRERYHLLPSPVSTAILVAIGTGCVRAALAIRELWFLLPLGLLIVGSAVTGLIARNRAPQVVFRVDHAAISIGPTGLVVPWDRVVSVQRVTHREQSYLRLEVDSPYRLVPMRSKRLRGWSPHVFSFNGQPINIAARGLPVSLDELEREILNPPDRLLTGSSDKPL